MADLPPELIVYRMPAESPLLAGWQGENAADAATVVAGWKRWPMVVRSVMARHPSPCSSRAALSFVSQCATRDTKLMVDEAKSWDAPECPTQTGYAMQLFSHTRRGEIGHHHHVAGLHLVRDAQEVAWREDGRRV